MRGGSHPGGLQCPANAEGVLRLISLRDRPQSRLPQVCDRGFGPGISSCRAPRRPGV
jgi:hypothetical protein